MWHDSWLGLFLVLFLNCFFSIVFSGQVVFIRGTLQSAAHCFTVPLLHCSTVPLSNCLTHIPNEKSIEKNNGALAQEQGATCKEQRLHHAALTMRFAQNTQYDTSKVLRLPCDMMMMMVSKVLHLPRKMQLIFRKRRQSIAPATLNDFRHVIKQVGMSPRCHACHAK